ncbi:MAG TPA: hypothetical protein VG621_02175 [Candidatus Paceibacterota bacterium]|nr:hypothetical protein [Candidatus Paceibacterota bacterium]
MSLLLQITLGVLIAGGIGFGVWNHEHHKAMLQPPSTTTTDETTAQPSTPSEVDVHDGANVNLSAGTTDGDLDADLSTIDQQLKAVNSDSVDIDQSMNDKPITQ